MDWLANVSDVGENLVGMLSRTPMYVLGAVGSPPTVTAISGKPLGVNAPATKPVGLGPTV